MSKGMSKTNIALRRDFDVPRPGTEVSVSLPTHEMGSRTTFTIPPGSKFTPGPHWHEQYTEIFRVLKGRVKLIKNGKVKIVAESDGAQNVPPFTIHEFMRADVDEVPGKGDEGNVIVEEWVDPGECCIKVDLY